VVLLFETALPVMKFADDVKKFALHVDDDKKIKTATHIGICVGEVILLTVLKFV